MLRTETLQWSISDEWLFVAQPLRTRLFTLVLKSVQEEETTVSAFVFVKYGGAASRGFDSLSYSQRERADHRCCCWEGPEDPGRTEDHLDSSGLAAAAGGKTRINVKENQMIKSVTSQSELTSKEASRASALLWPSRLAGEGLKVISGCMWLPGVELCWVGGGLQGWGGALWRNGWLLGGPCILCCRGLWDWSVLSGRGICEEQKIYMNWHL